MWDLALWIALVLYLLLGCFVPRDPTQCNFIGSLIGGALGLLGASKQRKEQRRINEANRPVNQVREWEEAEINPIFGLSSGSYVPHQAASIGDAYSEAGARFGQAFDQYRAEKLAQTELKQENTKLREKLDAIYDAGEVSYLKQYAGLLPLPTQGEINGQSNRQNSGPVSGDLDGASNLSPKSALRSARAGGAGDPSDYTDVKAPAVKLGIPWTGSGAISSGESFEDALGDNPLSWVSAPLVLGDMIGHTIGQGVSRRQQRKADKAMDEWFRREREGDPISRDPFETQARRLQSQNPYYRP